MKEAKWAVCENPRQMWDWVGDTGVPWRLRPSDRKQRLFAVTLSRLIGPDRGELSYGGWQAALANAEGMAAGRLTFRTPGQFWVDNPDTPRAIRFGLDALRFGQRPAAAALLRDLLGNPWRETPREPCTECSGGYVPTHRDDNTCLRCRGRGWHFPRRLLTPDVLSLAQAAREFRAEGGWLDPARLALLADALEDAGAVPVSPAGESPHREEALLRHLRGFAPCRGCMLPTPENAYWQRVAGPHALGCWALDAVSNLW